MRRVWTPASGGRPGQRTGMGAGGEHEAVEAQRAPVVELEGVPVDVERAGDVPEAQVEPEGGDLLGRSQQDAVEPPRAGQELLGQRRPVVGEVGLGADQDDRARRGLRRAASRRRAGRPATRRRRRWWNSGARAMGGRDPSGARSARPVTARHEPNIVIHCSAGCGAGRRSCAGASRPSWPRARASTGARGTAWCRRRSVPGGW